MIVEFHDDDIVNVEQGTLSGRAGAHGDVQYAYQAEMWVKDMFEDPTAIRRAYAISNTTVLAVWHRAPNSGMHYVARHPNYGGEWELPYEYPEAKTLVAGVLGKDVQTLDEAVDWAATQLRNDGVACVVLLDHEGLLRAWENLPDGPSLVARSPRPLPARR